MQEGLADVVRPSRIMQHCAFGFCVIFGFLLISQVQVAGDGMWYWYAVLLNSGHHLYRDLHLPLQPLYPLLVAGTLRALGPGWIVSKLPAVVFMVLYAAALWRIVRALPGNDFQRAAAILLGFGMPLLFDASRFDDYHVLTDTFAAYSILLLLRLTREERMRSLATHAAALGVLSGLATVSRLNDGVFLALAVALVLFGFARERRLATVALFAGVAATIALSIVLLTGDTIQDWATNSIFRAAGAKGGVGKLLLAPFALLGDAASLWFKSPSYPLLQVYTIALCAAVGLVYQGRLRKAGVAVRAAVGGVLVVLLYLAQKRWGIQELPRAMADLAVPMAFLAGASALFSLRRARNVSEESPDLQLLILLPVSQLLSGSMSSGGTFVSLASPLGMVLVLLPLVFQRPFRAAVVRTGYAAGMLVMALCCFLYKEHHPFFWHSYQAAPFFAARQVYHHPLYGPMVIETRLLTLVEPMCEATRMQPDAGMLTLPFPYPNYFCGIAPWHGNVQTFFDISTAETVNRLHADLQQAPPAVIVYQRQMGNLALHERLYNGGHALPQRALDELIGHKLEHGEWTALSSTHLQDSDWIVIRTRPVRLQGGGIAR